MASNVTIRPEEIGDRDAVRDVLVRAFPTASEAGLVDALREAGKDRVSLVAVLEGRVVGTVLFSPVTVDGCPGARGLGLAPMAVLPELQRSGIGSALVRSGLAACSRDGYGFAVVLGHASYYPRFGFRPARTFGLAPEFDVPWEVFMALELEPGGLSRIQGVVRYAPEFQAL